MTQEEYILSRLGDDVRKLVPIVNTDLMSGPVYGLDRESGEPLFWGDDRIGTVDCLPWDYSKARSMIEDAIWDLGTLYCDTDCDYWTDSEPEQFTKCTECDGAGEDADGEPCEYCTEGYCEECLESWVEYDSRDNLRAVLVD